MQAKWTAAPYSLTLDELLAQDPQHSFLHNDIIYVGTIRLETTPEGPCYVVVPRGAATPRRLLGSTMVTPVAPVPPPNSL